MTGKRDIRLVSIRNYIALKLVVAVRVKIRGLVSIRNYIALKLGSPTF